MHETIAAIATPLAESAIGIVRLSGRNAISIAAKFFQPVVGGTLETARSHHMLRGLVLDTQSRPLDDAMAVVFRAPNSYTGEDIVEFHCHGSPVVLAELLNCFFRMGARSARPGEFTKRAFLSGRLDLAQAEAVIDIISAETVDAARNAAGQLGGVISRMVTDCYDKLSDVCAHFGACVDYPDEDIEPMDIPVLASGLRQIAGQLTSLSATYERGRILKNGVTCVLVGRPNVGKSSLLNALVGYDRAIVTPRAGTTRDTIEECVHMGGVLLRLVDTAGIRESDDEIERLGVERTIAAAQSAQMVFVVLDGSQPLNEDDRRAIDAARGKTAVIIVNKSDLEQNLDIDALEAAFLYVLKVNSLTGDGLDKLESLIRRRFESAALKFDGSSLTNTRHAEAVARAGEAVEEAAIALEAGMTLDAVLMDVETAMSALGEITGRLVSEDILARIFDRFCVGK